MREKRGKISKYSHIKRLFGIYFGILLIFIIVRPFIIPKSFGEFGHYRANSIQDNINLPTKYVDIKECEDCHEKEYEEFFSHSHKNLNCQICHAFVSQHIDNPEEKKPSKEMNRDFCGKCHFEIESRPSSFPQIDEKLHNPEENCISCHSPHNPSLK